MFHCNHIKTTAKHCMFGVKSVFVLHCDMENINLNLSKWDFLVLIIYVLQFWYLIPVSVIEIWNLDREDIFDSASQGIWDFLIFWSIGEIKNLGYIWLSYICQLPLYLWDCWFEKEYMVCKLCHLVKVHAGVTFTLHPFLPFTTYLTLCFDWFYL